MKKFLAILVIIMSLVVCCGPALATASGPSGPAPNSGDGVPDGSGMDGSNGPNGDGSGTGEGPNGPAPNSGDGVPDGRE